MTARGALALILITVLSGCTASQPKNTGDICAIFFEKDDW